MPEPPAPTPAPFAPEPSFPAAPPEVQTPPPAAAPTPLPPSPPEPLTPPPAPFTPEPPTPPPPPIHDLTSPPAPGSTPPGGQINLNSVTFEQLREQNLSVTQATRLLAHRERLGGFQSVDDLDQVAGFPPDLLLEIKSRAAV
jgi:Helix-hairpin-helix motif